MSKIDLVKNWLSSEGYKHEIDSDGDIHFRYQGVDLFFTKDENDPLFFRIIMPGIYTVNGDREKVLEAVNSVCAERKVLKAFVVQDKLWLAIEMLIDTTPDIEDFFERCCDMLVEGRKFVAEKIFG